MDIIKTIGASIFGIADKATNIADKFISTEDEKNTFALEIKKLVIAESVEIENSLRTEFESKEKIMVAELSQSDLFTKRARPAVIYCGLAFIFINYCLIPIIAFFFKLTIPSLNLPPEFMYGWSGIVMTYAVGRSVEKKGISNQFTKIVTGK